MSDDNSTPPEPDDALPDPTEAQAEAMAFDAARRQYMKEQFISGKSGVPELEDLPVPRGKTPSAFDRLAASVDASRPSSPGKPMSAFDALTAKRAAQQPTTPTSPPSPEPHGPDIELDL